MSFAFLKANNPALATDVVGVIDGTQITARVPFGSGRAELVATFETIGESVTVGGQLQTSGVTANSFDTAVTYVVAAADLSTTSYAVAVGVEGFSAAMLIPAGIRPRGVVVSDFDGDGTSDIAVGGSAFGNGIRLLTNTTQAGATTPSFSAAQLFQVPIDSGPEDIDAADFNADGKPDVTLASARTWVAYNTSAGGTAGFAYVPDIANVFGSNVATGDVNFDGKPDLVTGRAGAANRIDVIVNTTPPGAIEPTFAPTVPLTTDDGPTSVAIADLNADDKNDLVVSNNNGLTVSVFLNTTIAGQPLTYSARGDFAVVGLPARVIAVDVNGDSSPDLVALSSRFRESSVSIFLNTTPPGDTTPSFAPAVEVPTSGCPRGLATADFDGDGRADLVTASDNCPGAVSILLNRTPAGSQTVTFATKIDIATTQQSDDIAIGDFNADSRPDLAVIDRGNGAADGGVLVLLSN